MLRFNMIKWNALDMECFFGLGERQSPLSQNKVQLCTRFVQPAVQQLSDFLEII